MARTKVQSELIATNAISGTIIADGAITSTHLAANCVDSSELVTGSIDTIHIAANQVTATKIVTNGVLTRHISDDQVTAAKLANSINTDIATGPAALPKAGGTMTGNLKMVNSSGATLDINSNASAADSKILLHEGTSASPANGASIRYDGANNLFKIGVGSSVDTTRLTIDRDTGNVGIGETNPAVPLHISKDSASGENVALLLDNNNTTAGNEIGILFRSMVGSTNTDFEIFGVANAGNDMDLVFESDGSNERVRFTGDGNVQIANGGKLVTKTTSGEVIRFERASDSNRYSSIHANSTDAGGAFIQFKVHTGASATSLADVMTLKGSGHVGIGTTNPSTLLHINGSGDAIRVESTNAGAGGAQMDLLHYTSSPADNDIHGMVNFGGYYSGTTQAYGSAIKSIWSDVSARRATMTFTVRTGGDFTERMRIFHDGRINVTEDDHTGVTEVDRILNWYGSGGTELNNSKHFLTAVNDRSETTQPMDVGLALTNKNTTNSNWSPAITFGGMSKNNGYMNGGAAIASQNTQNSADANFITSDLHFFTKNEDNSKSLSSKMKISGDGIVTTPQQPKFLARRNVSGGSYNPFTYSLSIPYNAVVYDEGSNFNTSTGLFTAPVDGMYMFQGAIYSVEASSGGWVQAWLTINGARGNYTDVAGNGMDNARIISTIHMVKLDSGDTVGYHPYGSNQSYQVYENVHHTWFRGTLLG